MAVAFRGRNSDFDWQKQCDRSDYFSLDETHDTDQQSYDHNTVARYPQLYTEPTEPTSQSSHGIRGTNDFEKLEANSAKNVTIPRYILLILVVVAIFTFMVCVTLLMIILLTKMPQNMADAAKEGHLVAEALKDLNISEGNLISAAIFLHELGETKEDVTALRKEVTANRKAVVTQLQKSLREIREGIKTMRKNLSITVHVSDKVLFEKISKPLSEINEDIGTLNNDLTEAQSKDEASLADIKKELKEIKQKLNSRAALTESNSFFSWVNVISILLISIFCLI